MRSNTFPVGAHFLREHAGRDPEYIITQRATSGRI